jgi:hypothetical protein
MTVAADRQFTLQFDGILTMTHHATNLDLPGEANITTAAGDVATFQSTGANTVQCINYTKADGTSVVGGLDDNSVTLAKMAHGTDGELITYDASGNPAKVAVGTVDHVLTSGGVGVAPTFQAAAGGGTTMTGSTANGILTYNSADNATVEAFTISGTELDLRSGGSCAINFYDVNTKTIGYQTSSVNLEQYDRVHSDKIQQSSQNGNFSIDGAYSSGGADYAEFFESVNGMAIPDGSTVTLDNDKIRLCASGETPIGVIRPNSSSSAVGNAHSLKWRGKFVRNDFDAIEIEVVNYYTWKDSETNEYVSHYEDRVPEGMNIPEDATVKVLDRKVVSTSYDPTLDSDYTPRSERDEWNVVGLLGQVPISKGQVTNPNWIKMKDISDSVEMWFIK